MTRDEALKKMQAVKSYMTSGNPIWSVTEMGEAFDMAIEALEQPEPKRGKWERGRNDDNGYDFRCSSCHRFRFHNGELRRYKYCPNCGATMEADENG